MHPIPPRSKYPHSMLYTPMALLTQVIEAFSIGQDFIDNINSNAHETDERIPPRSKLGPTPQDELPTRGTDQGLRDHQGENGRQSRPAGSQEAQLPRYESIPRRRKSPSLHCQRPQTQEPRQRGPQPAQKPAKIERGCFTRVQACRPRPIAQQKLKQSQPERGEAAAGVGKQGLPEAA